MSEIVLASDCTGGIESRAHVNNWILFRMDVDERFAK